MADAGPVAETFTVAILGPGGRRVGLGALVGPQHVVTCAHVVNAALGLDRRQQGKPDGQFRIIFPLLDGAKKESLTASVVMWRAPPASDAEGEGDDFAGLIIRGDLPGGAKPGRLADTPRTSATVKVFGYPAYPSRPDGGLATAVVQGPVTGKRLQLDRDPRSALRVQQGFSGSPVFDPSTGHIVGLVVLADPDPATADSYAVGSDLLREAWPEILGNPGPMRSQGTVRKEAGTYQPPGKAPSGTLPPAGGVPGSRQVRWVPVPEPPGPVGGKTRRGDLGGGRRVDAKRAVLITMIAVITVLVIAAVPWPTLMHVLAKSAAPSPSPSPRSSPSPSPSATQPDSTLPALTLPFIVSNSPSPALPSPTQEPSSSPAVVPSDFDNVATDPTQVSVATMLPQQFNDSGVVFTLTSSAAKPCPTGEETAGVSDTLTAYGCTSEIVGSYLDSSLQIQVTVWVVPMPDKADSEGAAKTLGTDNNWGIWCPTNTAVVGSQVCQGDAWQNATRVVGITTCHRYLTRALALYVDLAPYSTAVPALTAAVQAATAAIGAQNIPIAQCWPSTVITSGS